MTTDIQQPESKIVLHVQTELFMHLLLAIRAGGFRVLAWLEQPGRYEVHDARPTDSGQLENFESARRPMA